MILSERGAINSAIAGSGFHLYPAGKLFELIKTELSDELKADFSPPATLEKLSRVSGPTDGPAKELFERDFKLLKGRLEDMAPEYDIESVFDKTIAAVPDMARRYYGIENFEAPRPKVVEYYFEGFADLYKDADWAAFNVNHGESKELGVPVGTYFKRSQVSPGLPEFVAFHEANHVMQEITSLPEGTHFYVPWLDEGLADVLGRMMLYRATGNEGLLAKIKNFRTEVEVTDPRKVTYHYGDQIAALLVLRGRLPFVKALLRERKKDPLAIDWNELGTKLIAGWDPHIAAVTAYKGKGQDAFRKRIDREEAKFRKDADLDQSDLKILGMFLATQPPACLTAEELLAALWFNEEVLKNQSSPTPKVEIREGEIPTHLKNGAERLAANYFVIKRKVGDEIIFEPYGGGLPYRLGVGEIRCSY